MQTRAVVKALTEGEMPLPEIEEVIRLVELGQLVNARITRHSVGVTFTPLSRALGKRATDLFDKVEIDTLEALQLCMRPALQHAKSKVGEATMRGIEEYMADRGASFWNGLDFESRAVAIYGELDHAPIQPVLVNALRTSGFTRVYPTLYAAGIHTLGDLLSQGRQGIMRVLGAAWGTTVLNWLRRQHIPLR